MKQRGVEGKKDRLSVCFVPGLVQGTLPVLLVKDNRMSCQKCCFAFQLILVLSWRKKQECFG